ncbi:MAG: hypothetical protein ACI828_002446 [Flavobacteriales bacterium]|jgi:hypothetical protein
MTPKFKIISGCLLFLFAVLIYLESTEKAPINWFPSYAHSDKIPYGTYVLYNSLEEHLEKDQLKEVNQPPYLFLADSSEVVQGTYFFINNFISFDDAEADRMLDWVAQGNTLFVASASVGKRILDTLHLDTETYYDLDNLQRKPLFQLSNPSLKKDHAYYIDLEIGATSFDEIDTLKTVVLGEFDLSKEDTLHMEEPKIHFISQAFGKGKILLHLMPEAFTNYAMLRNDNYDYLEGVLKYLPTDRPIYWDNHYNNGKASQTSPLYVFLNNRYMKWAYYMLIIGVLLWVFFEGKRKQRAIPIVTPLPNKTIEFTETIAGMYLDKKDHTSIAYHQINYFFDFARSEYYVNTGKRDAAFLNKVHLKSGNSKEETGQLFQYIEGILAMGSVSQEQLLRLNKLIEAFKNA